MNKWEYKRVTVGKNGIKYFELEDFLNKLGEDGWEVTGTFSPAFCDSGACITEYEAEILLKRQKA